MTFTHAHNHAQYSLLDGHGLIENYVAAAAADGQPALALTDHGTMAGAIEFYSACKYAGLNPLVGSELYIDLEWREQRIPYHLTVLAADETGYRQLVRASTEAAREFYYRPRLVLQELIDADMMRHWIVLSGCPSSAMSKALLAGDEQRFLALYGAVARASKACFIEVMYHKTENQEFRQQQSDLLHAQFDVAQRHGLPLVLTNDCHYVTQAEEQVHQAFIAQVRDRLNGIEFDGEGFYLKTSQEMRDVAEYLGHPEAYDNTALVASMCDLHLPEVDAPQWYVPSLVSVPEATIKVLCEPKLERLPPEYRARFDYEMSVITTSAPIMNSYIVAAFLIDWCKEQGIPAAGRGSMAGSLVSHLLGITTEDPVFHNLLFKRAVNPARLTIPDFDIDVSSLRRKEVLGYISDKYPQSAAIASYSEHGPRGATRMVMRVTNHTMEQIGEVTKQLPDHDTEPDLTPVPENLREVVRGYLGLYGNMTVHPAGVLIAGKDKPLDGLVPMAWVPSSKQAVAQYNMYTLKKLNLFKLDVLGLNTLDALAYLERVTGVPAPTVYEEDDVFKALAMGFTSQIFQMDGFAARSVIKRLGIKSFDDIVAINTLVRPGASQFIDAYHSGEERLMKQYPPLRQVLAETRGLILYQEQVMEVCEVLAGFDDLEQDDIKEAIKYFRAEVFAAIEPRFMSGCAERGHDGKDIWVAIKVFSTYTYNKAHAVTYAALAYKMQWYKVKYPEQFYAATFDDCNPDNKARLILESQVFSVRWVMPDVNASEYNTRYDPELGVVIGLGAIKGIGEAVANAVAAAKPYSDVEDLKGRVVRKACNVRHIALLEAVGAIGDAPPARVEELLGFSPLLLSRELLEAINIVDRCQLGGFVTEQRERTTKKGDLMGFLTLSNGYGEHKAVLFARNWAQYKKKLKGRAGMVPVVLEGEWNERSEFTVADVSLAG